MLTWPNRKAGRVAWRRPDPAPTKPTPTPAAFSQIATRLLAQTRNLIEALDDVEAATTDPVLLNGLYGIDHHANIMERTVLSLAALSETELPPVTTPVAVSDLVQAGIGAVHEWRRVAITNDIPGIMTHGAPATAISHMITECADNLARSCTSPGRVLVTATLVAAGIAIDLHAPMAPMPAERLHHYQNVLNAPGAHIQTEMAEGRLGFITVAHLAARYDIPVHLGVSYRGGNHVAIVIPRRYLAFAPDSGHPGEHDRP